MSIQEDIKAFVDGELSPELTATVGSEIEKNSELSQQVAFYRLLGEEIRELAVEPKVIGADEALAAVRRGRRINYREFALPFAVMAMVFVVGGLSSRMHLSGGGADSALKMVTASTVGANYAEKTAAAEAPMAKANVLDAPAGATYSNSAPDLNERSVTSINVTKNVHMPTQTYGPQTDPSTYWSPQGYNRSIRKKDASAAAANSDITVNRTDSGRANAKELAFSANKTQADAASGRMVVQNGTIDVAVNDPSRAQSETLNYVRSIGGFAESSSLDRDVDQNPQAQLTLRVPVARFSNAMDFLKRLTKEPKDVKSQHITGQDVTGEFADTKARLRVMRSEEEDYVQMLKNVRHMDDILTLKDKLSDVRQQIESLESQAATLKDTSALSTIQATFEQLNQKTSPKLAATKPVKGWADQAWASAGDGATSLGQFIATGAIFAFVYAPFWLPVALAGWWFTRKKI